MADEYLQEINLCPYCNKHISNLMVIPPVIPYISTGIDIKNLLNIEEYAKNREEYAKKIEEGTKRLCEKFPDDAEDTLRVAKIHDYGFRIHHDLSERSFSGPFYRKGKEYEFHFFNDGSFLIENEKENPEGLQIFDNTPTEKYKEPLVITRLRFCDIHEVDLLCEIMHNAMGEGIYDEC